MRLNNFFKLFVPFHYNLCIMISLTYSPTYNASEKHESTLLHTYELNEFLTADHPCTTKYFWKNLYKLVAHIFMLLLAPFTSKLANYSRPTLNFRKNSKSTTFSFENSDLSIFQLFSKTHCASNNWPIWTQKVPKEA